MSCLQIQAKVIAVIEMILSILFILLFGVVGIVLSTKKEELLHSMEKYPDEADHPHLRRLLEAPVLEQLSIFVVPIFYFIGELALGVLLFRSVDKLNHKRLRLWLIITGTLLAVGLIFFFAEILRNEDFWDVAVVTLVNSVFTVYSMWVVYSLIGEIKAGGLRHPVPYHNGFYKL